MADPAPAGPMEDRRPFGPRAPGPGRRLGGRYRLEARIGGGGMADVWSARDERLDRPVAVKIRRPDRIDDPGGRRFAHEARSAGRLSHPNVVAVYDAGEEDGVAFLVMELVAGESLAERISRGRLPPGEVRAIGRDVLAGLDAAHSAGILHRDVKPGNILLVGGRAKLADFGIAKSTDPADVDATGTALVIGTPSYLAPERAAGGPATPRTDVWSVGVLLYEALTGARPFGGPTPLAVALAARSGEHVPIEECRPGVDPALAAAIERSIRPDPGARFARAADLARALGAGPDVSGPLGPPDPAPVTVRSAPTEVGPPAAGPTERGRRPVRRRPIVVGGGVVTAVVAALAAWALSGPGDGVGAPAPTTTSRPPGPAATAPTPGPTTPATAPSTTPATTAPRPSTVVHRAGPTGSDPPVRHKGGRHPHPGGGGRGDG